MKWSIVVTAIFVVGVSCGPVEIPAPSNELEPPKFEAVPFNDDLSTPATDLVPPPEVDVPAPATDLVPPAEDKVVPTPSTELLPPFEDNLPTLATDLVPPAAPEEDGDKHPVMLFLINIFAVKNHTAEDSNDVLHSDFMEEVPEESAEPLAMFLLVVEDEDEKHPVNLDEVAKDLENEGFVVDKVVKNGETQLIKVDLASVESLVKVDQKNDVIEKIVEDAKERRESEMKKKDDTLEKSGKLMKLRRKRHICLKCMLDDLKAKPTYGGGSCNTCGGGGSYFQPQPSYQPAQIQPVAVPVVVVPVQTGGGGYQKRPHYGGDGGYYPQPQPQPVCNICQQGGHYPQGGGGGGNSYAQASAQASASASSYGK